MKKEIVWHVEKRKVADLKPHPDNARIFTEKGMQDLKRSINSIGMAQPINITKDGVVLSGHARLMALQEKGVEEVDVYIPNRELTAKEQQEVLIRMNANIAGLFDWDKAANIYEMDDLTDWGCEIPDLNVENDESTRETHGSLSDKFLYPPFSVLNAKGGEWQNRKKLWINKGLKSEVGRDDNLLFMSMQVKYPSYYDQKAKIEKKLGHEISKEEFEEKYLDRSHPLSTTSIFDPVLCEIAYSWFSKKGDKIIDPFAGGSVRGVVANYIGRDYTGIDLRKEQIDANYENAKEIIPDIVPNWLCGDSNKVLDTLENDSFDMCLSCPPYADLEVYSKDADDLSNMEYQKFLEVYGSIIKKTYDKLKNDSFCVWVIGEVRGDDGNYYNFLGDTITAFLNAGFKYYNEIVLETAIGTSAMRATKMFKSGRKVCKVHQNVLVFVKGDGKKATDRCGDVEIAEISEENEKN